MAHPGQTLSYKNLDVRRMLANSVLAMALSSISRCMSTNKKRMRHSEPAIDRCFAGCVSFDFSLSCAPRAENEVQQRSGFTNVSAAFLIPDGWYSTPVGTLQQGPAEMEHSCMGSQKWLWALWSAAGYISFSPLFITPQIGDGGRC